MSQGASSCRNASAIVAMALFDAETGPVNGGVNRVRNRADQHDPAAGPA